MSIAVAIQRRRAANPNSGITEVRPLVAADITRLRDPVPPTPIARLRDSHHEIAQLSAMGLTAVDISARVGYSYQRVLQLLRAPNMIELVDHYSSVRQEVRVDSMKEYERLKDRTMKLAERAIVDQLEDSLDTDTPLPLSILNRLAVDRMDRNGYGKQTTNINVNLDFARKLEAAIARSQPKVIEHE